MSMAPAEIYTRSEEDLAIVTPNNSHQQKTSKLIVYILIAIVLQSTFMLIFASIFLKTISPTAKLKSLTISGFQKGAAISPSLNLTVLAEIEVDNPNFGRFVIKNSKASVTYENLITIGYSDIFGGVVRARKTGVMKFKVKLRFNESSVWNNTNFRNDFGLGFVKLRSYAKLRGRVHVMNIVKSHKIAILNCTMSLNLERQSLQALQCR